MGIAKKMAGWALCLAVAVALLPAFGAAAYADETYNVWVLGTQVTSANKGNVLADTGTGKVSYDPGSNTLTVSRDLAATGTDNAVRAYVPGVLNIRLSGDRSISSEAAGVLYASSDVEIVSDGDVAITCASDSFGPIGNLKISTSGDVTLENTKGRICNIGLTIAGVDGGAAGNVNVSADTTTLSGGKFVAQIVAVNASGDVEIANAGGAVSTTNLIAAGANMAVTGNSSGALAGDHALINASGDVTLENTKGRICNIGLAIAGVDGGAAGNVNVSADTASYENGKFAAQVIEIDAAGNVEIANTGGVVAMRSASIKADRVLLVGAPAGSAAPDSFSYQNAKNAGYSVYEGESESALSVVATKAAGESYSGDMNVNVIKIAPVTYTVTFDSDGGSVVASQAVEDGGKVEKPADPTKEGYDFAGWTFEGKAWDFDSNTVTGDITLVAEWKEKDVDGNGGSESDQPTNPEGDEPKKPEPNDGDKSDKEDVIAQTGDDAPFAGLFAAAAAAGIAVLSLRRRVA